MCPLESESYIEPLKLKRKSTGEVSP
jgi:hypothetical protein